MISSFLTLLIVSQVNIDWNNTPDQIWTSQDWHANRLQDWQVQDQRVICTEISDRFPMRTLHLLTARPEQDFTLEVTTGTIDLSNEFNQNAWPRWAKPLAPIRDQYIGWPITLENIGKFE